MQMSKPKCKQCNERDVFAKDLCSGCYGRNWREARKAERAAAIAEQFPPPKQLTSGVTTDELEPAVIEGEIIHDDAPGVPETHLTAVNPLEMHAAQGDLKTHLEQKLTVIEREIVEANKALSEARRNGWATGALTSARNRLVDDETYYNKILMAVEAGHTIIPEFPVEVFAVRQGALEKRESQTYINSPHSSDTQQGRAAQADCAPAGAGEYRNPEPQTFWNQWENKAPNAQERGEPRWYTNVTRSGKPVGPITFPSTTARSPIMRAVAKAMEEKVFDQIGACLPVQKAAKGRVIRPQPRRRQPSAAVGDPLVIGQILRKNEGGRQKCVSFIIAWYLNLEDL
jgi:hypothetical protein